MIKMYIKFFDNITVRQSRLYDFLNWPNLKIKFLFLVEFCFFVIGSWSTFSILGKFENE